MFNDEESADTVFEMGEHQSKNSAEKVAKVAPVTFHAHRLILKACSAILADLIESEGGPTTRIEITNVSADVFRLLLYYIYGGKIADEDMKFHVREIIDAADKYGVISLKLEAEAHLVQATTFTIENVKEVLIYADSMNCALLKEAAMDFILENKAEVLKKLTFVDAPGNLMSDLLAAVARGEGAEGVRISELRQKAHEKGLEVDGSREMLIAALEAYT
jgi:hypothetical protein